MFQLITVGESQLGQLAMSWCNMAFGAEGLALRAYHKKQLAMWPCMIGSSYYL